MNDYSNHTIGPLCPLIMAGWAASRGLFSENRVSCLGSHCAWWDAENRRCAALSVAKVQ